jgi:CheY-like chemotaxis protein
VDLQQGLEGENMVEAAAARVLVIEENAALQGLMADLLDGAGYRVVGPVSLVEGPSLARRARPDVVLLNVGLPGSGGWEVLAALRDDPATRHIPTVLISASGETPPHAHATAHELVRIPCDLEVLSEQVERAAARCYAGTA